MDDLARAGNLESASRLYWSHAERHGGRIKANIEEYIAQGVDKLGGKSLLAAELEWACVQGTLPRARPKTTLVLLVGHSFEPLLQSVCAYAPKAILPVLSDHYFEKHDGITTGEDLLETIQLLVTHNLLDHMPYVHNPVAGEPGLIVADTTAAVFSGLVRALHGVGDVLLDITGGKKSMVAGAFLYATFANAPITYVDFDEYDPKHRRPYGYTCKIKTIANPYQQFSLRDWERVRTLYRAYRFQDARALLAGGIADATKVNLGEAKQGVATLADVLACYAAWENGDFAGAVAAAESLCAGLLPHFSPPTAVMALGPHWINGSYEGIYDHMERMPIYIVDELARIRRAIRCNHDYRTGFLRAGSLNEIIMLARLVRMARPDDNDTLATALYGHTPGARNVFGQLSARRRGEQIRVGSNSALSFIGAPELCITVNERMTRWWEALTTYGGPNGWEDFIKDRNELTHKYAAVTAATAEAAYAFVEANAKDFLALIGAAPTAITAITRVPSWPQLCRTVGVARWLPPNLVEGEETPCDEPVPAGR